MLVQNAAIESKHDSSFSVIIRAEDEAPYKTIIQLMDKMKEQVSHASVWLRIQVRANEG